MLWLSHRGMKSEKIEHDLLLDLNIIWIKRLMPELIHETRKRQITHIIINNIKSSNQQSHRFSFYHFHLHLDIHRCVMCKCLFRIANLK